LKEDVWPWCEEDHLLEDVFWFYTKVNTVLPVVAMRLQRPQQPDRLFLLHPSEQMCSLLYGGGPASCGSGKNMPEACVYVCRDTREERASEVVTRTRHR